MTGRAAARVVLLHGARGSPDTNWFPWLATELAGRNVSVSRPRLPTPDGQSLPAWLDAYDRAVPSRPTLPTILVGYSLGAAFALRLVERAREPFAGLFLVAGFDGALGLPDYDDINRSFFATPFDWTAIRERRGPACRCWAGEDDPYVPLPRSREVADRIGAFLAVVPGGGHLGAAAGFGPFPALRDAVLAASAGA